VRDLFVLSNSDKLMAASGAIRTLLPRESEVREEFERSASDNTVAPSLPISLPVSSENELKQQVYYC
jgi:hypothetical protein